MNRQVKVPHDFFAKSKKEYSNWSLAFIRELIQNSYDAGASRMDFFVEEGDDLLTITCRDNGKGMNEKILDGVFLSLGGSTKNLVDGDGNIGVMGYAKVVICFAHHSYTIHTQDNLIEGCGGEYSLSKAPSFLQGAEFKINMVMDGCVTKDTFSRHIYTLVNASTLHPGFSIYLNDQKVVKQTAEYPYEFQSTLGKVSFADRDDSYSSSELWVRVNGLAMFNHSSWSDSGSGFVGILDLDGHPLEYLTANRDSLKREHARSLNDLFRKLSDERTALKCRDLINLKFNEFSDVPADLEAQCTSQINGKDNVYAQPYSDTSAAPESVSEQSEEETFNPFESLVKQAQKKTQTIQDRLQSVNSGLFPENFCVTTKNVSDTKEYTQIVSQLKKVCTARLAHQWKAAVMGVLSSKYMRDRGITVINRHSGQVMSCKEFESDFELTALHGFKAIRTGFVFSKEVEGLNTEKENEYIISLNPNNIPEDWTFDDLVDVAQHECVHLLASYHDERFCSLHIEVIRSTRRSVPAKTMERTAKRWFKAAKSKN